MSEFFLKFDFKGEFTNDILDSDCQNFLSVVLVLLGWTLIVCRWKLKLTCREKCEKDPNKRKETETFEGPSDFSEKHYSLLVSLPPTNNRVLLWVQQRFWWCQLGLCLSGPAEVDLVERTLVWTHSCWVVWFCRNINSSFTRHKHLTTLKLEDFLRGSTVDCDWFVPSVRLSISFNQQNKETKKINLWKKKKERTPRLWQPMRVTPYSPAHIGSAPFHPGVRNSSVLRLMGATDFPKNHLYMNLISDAFKNQTNNPTYHFSVCCAESFSSSLFYEKSFCL